MGNKTNHKIKEYEFEELHQLRGKELLLKDFSIHKDAHKKGDDVGFMFPFRTDHHVVILLLEGNVQVTSNLTTHELQPNDVISISGRMVTQSIEFLEDSVAYVITFTQQYALKYIDKSRALESFQLLAATSSKKIALNSSEFQSFLSLSHYLELKSTQKGEAFLHEKIVHTFNLIFFELNSLYTKYHPKLPMEISRKEELAASFIQLLSKHLKQERSVNFYADALHVTSGHLSKTLKQVSGKSANQLIDEAVVLEAKILLADKSLSIAQIADVLHFSDQSYFGKFFKKESGISPSTYRSSLVE